MIFYFKEEKKMSLMPRLNLNDDEPRSAKNKNTKRRSNKNNSGTSRRRASATPDTIPAGDIVAVWVFRANGTHQEFPKDRIHEVRKAIDTANNTRRFWMKEGADYTKAVALTDKGLVEQINDQYGTDYKPEQAIEAAKDKDYIIVLLEVKYDPEKRERVPVSKNGCFNVLDTRPATEGPAEDK